MYCHKCGEKLKEGSNFCHNCGTAIEEKITAKESGFIDTPQTNEQFMAKPKSVPKSNAGLVMGIISLFFLGIVFGSLAIYYSYKPEEDNKSAARALGIVGLIFGIVKILGFLLPIILIPLI